MYLGIGRGICPLYPTELRANKKKSELSAQGSGLAIIGKTRMQKLQLKVGDYLERDSYSQEFSGRDCDLEDVIIDPYLLKTLARFQWGKKAYMEKGTVASGCRSIMYACNGAQRPNVAFAQKLGQSYPQIGVSVMLSGKGDDDDFKVSGRVHVPLLSMVELSRLKSKKQTYHCDACDQSVYMAASEEMNAAMVAVCWAPRGIDIKQKTKREIGDLWNDLGLIWEGTASRVVLELGISFKF
ncbi:hypothetical protein Tco_0088683 [Tanacetum coccineum]